MGLLRCGRIRIRFMPESTEKVFKGQITAMSADKAVCDFWVAQDNS